MNRWLLRQQKGRIIMSKKGQDVSGEEEMDFESMMEQRIQSTFGAQGSKNADVSSERLREMSKKLPAWSLEPPYSFLK